jgi:hypothetical protein
MLLAAQQTSIPNCPTIPLTEEQLKLQQKRSKKREREREQNKQRRVVKAKIRREANSNGD